MLVKFSHKKKIKKPKIGSDNLNYHTTRQYYLGLANEENCFKIQLSVCIDHFKQYFDSSLLSTSNDLQSFL